MNLNSRIVTTIMLVPIIVIALFLLPLNLFGYLIIIISTLAAWEWSQFIVWKKQIKRIVMTLSFFLMMLILQFYLHDFKTISSDPIIIFILLTGLIWWLLAIILVLTFKISSNFWANSSLLKVLFGVFTIIPFYSGMIVLKSFDYYYHNFIGTCLALYVMLLVWSFDIGAYFFGQLFGKHKLAVQISPGKTFEGVFGGVLISIIVSCLFSLFINQLEININFLFCSVVIVIISIFGDLTESMLKRKSGIKNSSNLIPGHGGILDRIDSLTSAIPIFTGFILLFFDFKNLTFVIF